jgi:hypothetical protein
VDAKDRAKGGLTLLSPKRQRTWTESTNSIGSQTSILYQLTYSRLGVQLQELQIP